MYINHFHRVTAQLQLINYEYYIIINVGTYNVS